MTTLWCAFSVHNSNNIWQCPLLILFSHKMVIIIKSVIWTDAVNQGVVLDALHKIIFIISHSEMVYTFPLALV